MSNLENIHLVSGEQSDGYVTLRGERYLDLFLCSDSHKQQYTNMLENRKVF